MLIGLYVLGCLAVAALIGECGVGVWTRVRAWVRSGTLAIVRAASIDTVPAENQCGPAEGHLRAVGQCHAPHRLAVHEVPFVEPRSTRTTSPSSTRSSAWCRETPGSTSRRSQSVPRPSIVTGAFSS